MAKPKECYWVEWCRSCGQPFVMSQPKCKCGSFLVTATHWYHEEALLYIGDEKVYPPSPPRV